MSTAMKEDVSEMLKGIERYNPHNLLKLEEYIGAQMRENFNDLEANLAVLKLYQLDPTQFKPHVCAEILIKALSNMPHTDFVLAKCLIDPSNLELEPVKNLCIVHHYLETCQFVDFWAFAAENPETFTGATGFYDAIRNYICYVIKITYQIIEKPVLKGLLNVDDTELQNFMVKNGWKEMPKGLVFITNQEEIIKTKNITETLSIEGDVAKVLATYR